MPQALSKVYVHIVFSTKKRVNYIDDAIEHYLFKYIGGICKKMKCNPVKVGGYRNHIHILCTLSRDITQSKLLQQIKQHSSRWMKTQGAQYSTFYWQKGYGIFSVNYQRIDNVIAYIENQKEHHSKESFKQEYIRILNENDLEFDERYVWE